MRRYLTILLPFVLELFLAAPSFGQEAISISKLVESDNDISISEISKINETIVVADTLEGWWASWRGGVNGAQAAYDNWSQGGANTISVTASTDFKLLYRKNRFSYALSTNMRYGKARIAEEGTRKTDDRIAINNKFSYLFNENWSGFANVNFSTQFDQGYDYAGPAPELLSEIFSPAYFTQIAGIAYSPISYFSAQTGLALKETIVANDRLAERYGLYTVVEDEDYEFFYPASIGIYRKKIQNIRFEPGYSMALFLEKDIFKNVHLVSSVETFTNLQRHIDRTDVSITNEVVGKVNDFLRMSFQFAMIYDEDFSKEIQVKQVLSAGLSVDIL